MNYEILSKERIEGSWKYRIAINDLVLVIWFKDEPNKIELDNSIYELINR